MAQQLLEVGGRTGDEARAVVPRTIEQIENRLCTVSRTVIVGTPVVTTTGDQSSLIV